MARPKLGAPKNILIPVSVGTASSILLYLLAEWARVKWPQADSWWNALDTLAIAVFVGVIIASVDHYVVIRHAAEQIEERLIDGMMPGYRDAGLRRFRKELPVDEMFSGLEEGDELLWLDTCHPPMIMQLDDLQKAVSKGVRFRMLVIDPESENAYFRGEEITSEDTERTVSYSDIPYYFKDEAMAFQRHLLTRLRAISKARQLCEVRQYKDLPSLPMYLVVRKGKPLSGITGMFLEQPSYKTWHLQWTQVDGGPLDSMVRFFNEKWNRQVPPRGKTLFPV
ncbi:MAG: hypothetical protein HW388_1092 [Dehalococcoidia bacterium]|nr:hypothetical protein [Dehalococcoidia bacterium]